MVTQVRPVQGGFLRPFGTAWFITEFLKGKGPEESTKIDPSIGAPMCDICAEYKSALHRVHARDAVELEVERRIRTGGTVYTEAEYADRLKYYLSRIAYKLLKMRYSSFTRYFGHLKRLGWVEETGKTEPSAIQDSYPPGPPRVYYRLTAAGWEAPVVAVSNPVRALYPQFDSAYARTKRKARQYARY
jgi:hypothetical protein